MVQPAFDHLEALGSDEEAAVYGLGQEAAQVGTHCWLGKAMCMRIGAGLRTACSCLPLCAALPVAGGLVPCGCCYCPSPGASFLLLEPCKPARIMKRSPPA